jgi:hypothetical protein
MNWLIIIIIIIIILLYIYLQYIEKFNNNILINSYVIHLINSTDRIEHIENQRLKSGIPLFYYDGVDGKTLNKEKLIQEGILCPHYAQISNGGHWGCFLSHKYLIDDLSNKYNNLENSSSINTDYSIIFEDDFNIVNEEFDNKIYQVINDLKRINYDFDIIYIGNRNINDELYDKQIVNNIYTLKSTAQPTTEAYIINNKSLKKISSLLSIVNSPIDWAFADLINSKKLNVLILNPQIVTQNRDFPSLIG